MNALNISAALITIPIFYMIYHRYLVFKPVISKHIQAFLSGCAYAILLVLSARFLNSFLSIDSIWFTAFIKAALLEKIGAFVILLLIYRHFYNFSMLEAILTAMMFGLGFSAVENMFYAYNFGKTLALLRLLFSSPLHLTTCAFMGFFLGRYVFAKTMFYKVQNIIYALTVPFLLHGLFDVLLLKGGYLSYSIAPLLIITIFVLEFLMAKVYSILPKTILDATRLRFEDYLVINKQKKYERWIKQSMGLPDSSPVALFLGKPGTLRILIFILLIFTALVGLSLREEIFQLLELSLKREDEVILLGIFPSFIGLTVILVGSINPDFFKLSELKIPVITDVDVLVDNTDEETLVTYDITEANCFLRTFQPLGLRRKMFVEFSFNNAFSEKLEAEVVWENHTNRREAMGTVISLKNKSADFFIFLIKYNWFRFYKGTIFTFKLPGFETTRKLFLRPISAVEDDEIYKPGTILFKEGEVGERFYLIKKGTVILYKQKGNNEIITIDTIDNGQILGEMSISPEAKHTASAICADTCIIASAKKQNLNALLIHNVDFSRSFIDTLVERIQMSEKILLQYITMIEQNKRENEQFFHATLMLIIIGLGHKPDGINENVDVKRMSNLVKKMSGEDMAEIIHLITYKMSRTDEQQAKVNSLISEKLHHFYSKFEIDLE
jgi:CRP-like cAMP-binding protein/RsiW-degrading membrane proteinase PrsW (M82 family)